MRSTLRLALLAAMTALCCKAQIPQQLQLTAPAPASTQVGAAIRGTPGATPLFYWVVIRYPIGAVLSGPTQVPNTVGVANLNTTNFVAVSWTPVASATGYDVIRARDPIFPSSCSACAVAVNVLTSTANDQGPGSAYTLPPVANAANAVLNLNNIAEANPFLQLQLNNALYGIVPLNGSYVVGHCPQFGPNHTFVDSGMTNCGGAGGTTVLPGNGILTSVVGANTTVAIDPAVVSTLPVVQAGTTTFCNSATGTAAYGCTLNPVSSGPYAAPGCVVLIGNASNTTTASLNVDTRGTLPIQLNGVALSVAGTITSGVPVTLCLNTGATAWDIQGGASTSSGGAFASSGGVIPAVTQTGSDVVIYSVASVPALASGQCYFFNYGFSQTGAVAVTTKLYVDSTNVGSVDLAHDWTGDPRQIKFSYCNDASVQNAQHAYDLGSLFCNAATDPCPYGAAWTSFPAFASPVAMTGINTAGTHTYSIRTNAASGTITGNVFRMGQ